MGEDLVPATEEDEPQRMLVVGGDGTLHRALNTHKPKELYYLPCGTVNDKGHTTEERLTVGRYEGGVFSYVMAVGSFTDIAYTASRKSKRFLGKLAYFWEAIRRFRPWHIHAKTPYAANEEGVYTLLMLLVGRRCFGFDFVREERGNHARKRGNKGRIWQRENKDLGDGTGENEAENAKNKVKNTYFLSIKAPKSRGFLGKIHLFLHFFRVFFVGIRPPYDRFGIQLYPTDSASIALCSPAPFCVDGERTLARDIHCAFCQTDTALYIVNGKSKRKERKRASAP